jgi:hypothetical protein
VWMAVVLAAGMFALCLAAIGMLIKSQAK